ncbi:ParB/RepB/Spo0J family partition protein [Isoptericola variabilis]|uniref:ParB-like partition protein n=1 Tax=Isoptericola variabilis (strain 225) TaxID=743718 RepID=F6FWQ1_ISOV2|nr:ParB/RepB/Spo0J family partition protein [Isoptericola variabilis]AEG45692.1 parB-like partition protein [Isoptericola variabilis 225]
MSQKRRGLGRGLGALIPSAPEGERPVDVFFPSGDKATNGTAGSSALAAVPDTRSETDDSGSSADSGVRASTRTRTWDSAIAGGRLKIRTVGADRASGTAESEPGETDISETEPGERTPDPIAELGALATRLESGAVEDSAVRHGPEYLGPELGLVSSIEVSDPAADATANEPEPGDVSRETEPDLVPVPGATFAEIPVGSIRPNTWQPRTVFDEGELDELVDSIRQIGVLQPIVVRPDKERPGEYELIMGERRWRAATEAGLDTIPAIIRSTEDSDMLRDALLENLHRAALNPLEEAAAYRQLLDDFGCTHEELASRIARSRPQISNTLRLLKLPPLVQRRVAAGVLSAGHARALLGLTDGAEIERLAQRIVSEGLSVRATEEIVTMMVDGADEKPKRRSPRAGQRSEAVDELATRLSDRFETRVKVTVGKTKGRMTVEFASVEDLNRILAVMVPDDPGLLKG